MQRRLAFMAIAAGIATFLAALYDRFGPASAILAPAGLGGLAVGLALLAMSLRAVAFSRPDARTAGLIALGAALHAWEQAQSLGSFSAPWFLWALLPYALCMAASTVAATRMPSVAAAAVVLLLDLWVHYGVFMRPASSTAVLALVFVPLWSTLVFAPLTMFVAWSVGRCIRLRGDRL